MPVAPLDPVDVLVVGERLEPDCAFCLAWLQSDGREEDAFPSEKHRLDAPRQLDAVVQVLGEGHQAARIHADRGPLRSQLLGKNGSTSLEDDHALARDLLQDERLASEECGAQPLPEARGDLQGVRPQQIHSARADDLAAIVIQVQRQEVPGDHGAEAKGLHMPGLVGEARERDGFPRKNTRGGLADGRKEAGLTTIPEDCVELDALGQHDHATRLCANTAFVLEIHLDEREVLGADDAKGEFVGGYIGQVHDLVLVNIALMVDHSLIVAQSLIAAAFHGEHIFVDLKSL
eukprot:CAMPEP_0183399868 /NCGR_PEP_ID=MMETSP0370-20130417/12221_1 /TAXON_ID=268820 /ORGANISM="Peridinium aciculiferum, Strain PAER-2" /LENGTH=289 /DNA_ID=CAMNT_0025581087 /DNA_START=132 /DNA_END=998 /DNA_ORIENTATION=+